MKKLIHKLELIGENEQFKFYYNANKNQVVTERKKVRVDLLKSNYDLSYPTKSKATSTGRFVGNRGIINVDRTVQSCGEYQASKATESHTLPERKEPEILKAPDRPEICEVVPCVEPVLLTVRPKSDKPIKDVEYKLTRKFVEKEKEVINKPVTYKLIKNRGK